MPVPVSYPGVYVQEAPSGVHTISGVATSVAAFVGMAPQGPVNQPVRVFNARQFDAIFGGAAKVGELPDQVRQFFLNGGGQAWIVRTAKNAGDGSTLTATSILYGEGGGDPTPTNPSLTISAKDAGEGGNQISVEIDYGTESPESTFNLTAYRAVPKADGGTERKDEETHKNLSMNPQSPRYAPTVITSDSDLISAASAVPASWNVSPFGISQSGLIFNDLKDAIVDVVDSNTRFFVVGVADKAPVLVDIVGAPGGADADAICQYVQDQINDALADAAQSATVTVDHESLPVGGDTLRIFSSDGPVVVSSAVKDDVASKLRLGVANGGLEADHFASLRPAPNGFVTRVHGGNGSVTDAHAFGRVNRFAAQSKGDLGTIDVTGGHSLSNVATVLTGTDLMAQENVGIQGVFGSFAQARKSLQAIAGAINSDGDKFDARVDGLRIRIVPLYGNQDSDLTLQLGSAGSYSVKGSGEIAQQTTRPANVVRYAIGLAAPAAPSAPGGNYRALQITGNNGEPPEPDDYEYAFDKLARTADIFNILVLPRARGTLPQTDLKRLAVWPMASTFCRKQRAFLIVDPLSDGTAGSWNTADEAANAPTGIKQLRAGLVADHAACYWSRVKAFDDKGDAILIDPGGTMAGVYANTDNRRGVWKAPAGLEATLLGVRGLEHDLTNDDNGITNPQALNTLRTMVSGATSWGARTMIGYEGAPNQDYKYIPVRRLALNIEESLYRGLQFAVFEPNGETLWGQIRLAAGAFMNGLFRQGAFKGTKKTDAYFVACGPETTTQTDINRGIVNVEVGFAPLKPAEFVILTIKQLVGQIEV